MRTAVPRWFSISLWAIIIIFVMLVITSPHWLTLLYPLPHRELVATSAEKYKVDPYLVFAIVRVESKFNRQAKSVAGATGLMQIMPQTGEWIAGKMGIKSYNSQFLTQPNYNIPMGTWYLGNLNSEFDQRLPLVVASYNAGRGNVRQWVVGGIWDGTLENVNDIPYGETRQYVVNVIKTYQIYQAIYREGRLERAVAR
ncbi:MAG: lytic transglycosylase domain-containing protein [Methylocystaceae bacterium]